MKSFKQFLIEKDLSIKEIVENWIAQPYAKRDNFPKSWFLKIKNEYTETNYTGTALRQLMIHEKIETNDLYNWREITEKDIEYIRNTESLDRRVTDLSYDFNTSVDNFLRKYIEKIAIPKNNANKEYKNRIKKLIWKKYDGGYVSWSKDLEGIMNFISQIEQDMKQAPLQFQPENDEDAFGVGALIKDRINGISFVELKDQIEFDNRVEDEISRIKEVIAPMSKNFELLGEYYDDEFDEIVDYELKEMKFLIQRKVY